MKHITGLLVLLLFSFSQTPEDIALKVEAKLRSLQSIQANFKHNYFSSSISTPLKEKGKFYYKKPDLMKWEYKEPEKRIYLLKGGFFFEYIPEDKQIIKYDLSKEGYEPEILFLLSGKKKISDNYSLEFSPFPTEHPKAFQLKLTPNREADYSFILLEINEKSWLIQKAIFFDWAGNKQEFHFERIRVNKPLARDLFELKAPPGVEIIKNR